jgi:hypothetical protein
LVKVKHGIAADDVAAKMPVALATISGRRAENRGRGGFFFPDGERVHEQGDPGEQYEHPNECGGP